MSRKEGKKKWKFFWKNIDGLGRINRLAAGIAALAAAFYSQQDKVKSIALTVMGLDLVFAGLVKWCPMRAILKRPTRRAYRAHYPEG